MGEQILKKIGKFLKMSVVTSAIAGSSSWYFTPLLWLHPSQFLTDLPPERPTVNHDQTFKQLPQLPPPGIATQDKTQVEVVAGFQSVRQEAIAQNLHQRSMGEIMQAMGEHFLGTPYKAGLLDQSPEEKLVVSLNEFDCVLFVETVLAIARGIAVQDYSAQTFVNHLQDQRYSHGKLNGYCSRLHYFSAWIADNQKRGTVENITRQLGGIPLNQPLNFMSQHWQSYPQLAQNDANYQCIVEAEKQLAKSAIYYLPQSQIRSIYEQLQPGDIVAVATRVPGLDVTHTGLVYRHSGDSVGFIHASPKGTVKVAPDLQSYIDRVEDAIGIIVARPIDPRKPN